MFLYAGVYCSLCNIFYYFLFLLSTGESLTSRYSRNTDQRLHTSFSSGEFARLKPKDMSSPLVSDHSDNGRRVISPIRRRSNDDVCIPAYSSPRFFFSRSHCRGRCSLSFQRSLLSYDDESVNETRTCNLLCDMANLVWQARQYCLEKLSSKLHPPSPNLVVKKHARNSPVTFVTHKRFSVLFFLLSCCANSLSKRPQPS